MNRFPALGLLTMLAACNFNPAAKVSIDAANRLAEQCSKEKLEARAAGDDCLVVLLRADLPLDDTTVESIHYGTGDLTTYPGGVQQFLEDAKFRAAVYEDADGQLWTYGSITKDEARSLPACR
jgi:hypothetical protein